MYGMDSNEMLTITYDKSNVTSDFADHRSKYEEHEW